MKVKLKRGDTVRVVGTRGTAKIRVILTSMHGAIGDWAYNRGTVVLLDLDH